MKKSVRIIKKYSNRRLYDTEESRYITLDELAKSIREGEEVQVIDAKSGDDLTQGTLVQIVIESRGAARFLPVPLLTQMIRMEDDALAEFMSAYVTYALEIFQQARRGVQTMTRVNPFMMTFMEAMQRGMSRDWMPRWPGDTPPWQDLPMRPASSREGSASEEPPFEEPTPDEEPAREDLRQELDELKEMVRTLAASQSNQE